LSAFRNIVAGIETPDFCEVAPGQFAARHHPLT
jgi:hypothetical protein